MARRKSFAVKADMLRWRCNPDRLGFETTDDYECCHDIIGQDRALDAIRLGLEIKSPGYNIYVSGLTGTGKSTTIERLLRSIRHEKKALVDICYLHNFRMPEMPVTITMPASQGISLKRAMSDLLETLREHIPRVFESESFSHQQKEIVEKLKNKRSAIASELEKIIADKGFRLLEVQYGPFTRPVIVPVIDDKSVELEKLPALVESGKLKKKDQKRIEKDHSELMAKMEEFLKISRQLDRALTDEMSALERRFVAPIVDTCTKEVEEQFANPTLHGYLKELREYSVENLDIFKESSDEEPKKGQSRSFLEYEVNVIVDNSRTSDIPVIIETSPTYANLFGTIERISESRSEFRTDFTMIRAGSLLRANGGFLVLSLSDIAEEPAVWPALKRALKNQQVTIQGFDSLMLMPISSIKPEPIDIDIKVVLIGDAESYQYLFQYDEDFKKIFKIKADFDTEMPNNQENLVKYSQFIKNILEGEGLLPFHKTAVAAVAEEGSRLAGNKEKLSTRFSDAADVVREASYWAAKDGAKVVKEKHVEKAVAKRVHRVNLIEEKIDEMLQDGTILIDVDGEAEGQINGLSVYDLGDHAFGKPSRITVETSIGREGIVNIEREAELSGKSYNKGVLILEGFFRRQYAQEKPLAVSASICFEQSYTGVDGDSASSTEIYGLLSSLAGAPLRQDLAVTGSVNQKGEIQPIGGVNEKVEGFFDVCRLKGFTGKQGVIIPKLNVVDLMLRKDVVKTIKAGKFHIYAVESIDEGIELLTGLRAGKRLPDGNFEKGSINDLVDTKLSKYAELLKDYGETGDEKE